MLAPSLESSLPFIIGRAPALTDVLRTVARVAPTTLPVLVLGESGTGKELLARAVHTLGREAAGPLVAVNCAALPRELAESELFGHDRGAFTGAGAARTGWFGAANGGTLVLDEIGELPLDLQPKLLRVLESGRYCRVGSRQELEARVRIVAMTNRDLAREARLGRFRLDLYHRLAGVVLELPPLRERREDIGPLALHFCTEVATELPDLLNGDVPGIAGDALELLVAQDWPGNVRELRNLVRSTAVLTGLPLTRPAVSSALSRIGRDQRRWAADAPAPSPAVERPATAPDAPAPFISLAGRDFRQIQEAVFRYALHTAGGSRRKAASLLGLSRSTFCDQVKRMGLV